MKTARERFQEGPHRADWEKIVAGEAFHEAIEAAQIEFISTSGYESSIGGVLEFVRILSSIQQLPKPPTPEPRPPELDYSVGKPKR